MKATGKSTSLRAGLSSAGCETPTSAYISGLEPQLCELSNHAYVVAQWIEDIFRHGGASEMLKTPNLYYVDKQRAEATLFLVYGLHRRIDEVRDAYYAALAAGAISQSPEQPAATDAGPIAN